MNRCKVDIQLNIYGRHYGTLRDLRLNSHFAWGNLFTSDAAEATYLRPAALRFTAMSIIFSTRFSFLTPIFVDSMVCRIFQFLSYASATLARATAMTLLWSPCGTGCRLFVLCGTSVLPFIYTWYIPHFIIASKQNQNHIICIPFPFFLSNLSFIFSPKSLALSFSFFSNLFFLHFWSFSSVSSTLTHSWSFWRKLVFIPI